MDSENRPSRPARRHLAIALPLLLLCSAALGRHDGELTTTRTLSVRRTTTVTIRPAATGPPLSHGLLDFNLKGCYARPAEILTRGRVEVDISSSSDGGLFGVARCLARCGDGGFGYAAVEAGRHCFCADGLADSARKVSTGWCGTPCASDPSVSCGGSGFAVLYSNRKLSRSGAAASRSGTVAATTTNTTTSTPTTPSASSSLATTAEVEAAAISPDGGDPSGGGDLASLSATAAPRDGGRKAALIVPLVLFAACVFIPLLALLWRAHSRGDYYRRRDRFRPRLDSATLEPRLTALPSPTLSQIMPDGDDDEDEDGDVGVGMYGRTIRRPGKALEMLGAKGKDTLGHAPAEGASVPPPAKAHTVLGLREKTFRPRRFSLPPPSTMAAAVAAATAAVSAASVTSTAALAPAAPPAKVLPPPPSARPRPRSGSLPAGRSVVSIRHRSPALPPPSRPLPPLPPPPPRTSMPLPPLPLVIGKAVTTGAGLKDVTLSPRTPLMSHPVGAATPGPARVHAHDFAYAHGAGARAAAASSDEDVLFFVPEWGQQQQQRHGRQNQPQHQHQPQHSHQHQHQHHHNGEPILTSAVYSPNQPPAPSTPHRPPRWDEVPTSPGSSGSDCSDMTVRHDTDYIRAADTLRQRRVAETPGGDYEPNAW